MCQPLCSSSEGAHVDMLRPHEGMKQHGQGHGGGGSTALSNTGRDLYATRMGMGMGIKGLRAPGGPGGHQSERSIHRNRQGGSCQAWHPLRRLSWVETVPGGAGQIGEGPIAHQAPFVTWTKGEQGHPVASGGGWSPPMV